MDHRRANHEPKKGPGPALWPPACSRRLTETKGAVPGCDADRLVVHSYFEKKGVRVLDMHVNENVQHLPTKKERDDDS